MSVENAKSDLARLRNEIARLEAQLAGARERAVKIENYIEITELYEAATNVVERGVRARSSTGSGSVGPIARTVVELLRERGSPIKTTELLIELEKRGITINGINRVSNLSAFLSRAKDQLRANRSEGWSLIEWSDSLPTHDDGFNKQHTLPARNVDRDQEDTSLPQSPSEDLGGPP